MSRHQDNAEILATRWISVKELGELGISCRKGPFTKEEVEQCRVAIERFQEENALDDEQLGDMIRSSQPSNGLWSYVARAVPQRGVKSVFYHVRRARDSLGKAGKWCPAEDERLQEAIQTHGNDWVAIADLMQRAPGDCCDRFRQRIQYRETQRRGTWSSEEEGQLLRAIEDLAGRGKRDTSARGFWILVSKAMRGTRTSKQCQGKWSDTLQGKVANEGKTRRWQENDTYILICKIASLDADNESDVNWKSLSDPLWNMWSGHHLQQKWRFLKTSSNLDGALGHRDIVQHLLAWVSASRQSSSPSTTTICTPLSPSLPSTNPPCQLL